MTVPPEFHASFPASQVAPPLALVTGGAKRIGAAFARALAAEGFRLVIHCNRSRPEAELLASEIAASGAPAPLVVQEDLAEPDIGERILDALPLAPAILINNASLFEVDHIPDFSSALWDRHIAVNLRAPALLIQAMARRLPQGCNGLVVNLSDAKLEALNPDYFSYTVSKIGLAGVTEMAARALAPRIRVNAIAPAVTLGWGPKSRGVFEKAHKMNLLGRGVEVEHLVAALLYLVRTPTVTGQTLTLDAGQRFLALPRDVSYMVTS